MDTFINFLLGIFEVFAFLINGCMGIISLILGLGTIGLCFGIFILLFVIFPAMCRGTM